MKVICIDNKTIQPLCIMPEVGEIVTALGESPVYPDSYYIAEYPTAINGLKQSLLKSHFIPLSLIDETEFERNYKKEPEWIEAFNKITVKIMKHENGR